MLEKYQINIWMFRYSQIQGTRSKKDGELRDRSVPYFQQESGPCPLDWRTTIHSNVDLVFFQQSWHIWLCWKIARTTFQYMVVLKSRGQNFILVEIYWSQYFRVELIQTNIFILSLNSKYQHLPHLRYFAKFTFLDVRSWLWPLQTPWSWSCSHGLKVGHNGLPGAAASVNSGPGKRDKYFC